MTSEEDQAVIDAMLDQLEDVAVPESLHPDAVRKRLLALEQAESPAPAHVPGAGESVRVVRGARAQDRATPEPRRRQGLPRRFLVAASVVLALGVGVWGLTAIAGAGGTGLGMAGSQDGEPGFAAVKDILTQEVRDDLLAVEEAARQPGLAAASSYGEIRASLLAYEAQQAVRYGGVIGSRTEVTDVQSDGARAVTESAVDDAAPMEAGAVADYSDTNVRTEGVGEADVVKTDGRYLYVLQDDSQRVAVVDVQDGNMEPLGCAQVDSAQISEFYVEGQSLYVLSTEYPSADDSDGALSDTRYTSASPITRLDTFDLSDPAQPRLAASATQSGSYSSSRFADGFIYVFSNYLVSDVAGSEDPATYVPCIGGKAIACSDVYLPPNVTANQYLVVSAFAADNPGESVSQKAVLSDFGQLYVSASNIYVYETIYNGEYDIMPLARTLEDEAGQVDPAAEGQEDGSLGESAEGESGDGPVAGSDGAFAEDGEWDNSVRRTSIRKLSFSGGEIEGAAQTKVDGVLDSSWSIDEYDGYLRLVTTLYDDEFNSVNAVYVLNGQLELVGSIEGLAEDERVYSARLMGDTGYFVTFRETDPLFSVDFSDPENPRIIGELKIPGFSEYLHPYGDGLLLGIGMEADEETGVTDGVKLSMFDVSDPAAVSEVAKTTIEGCYHTDVFYDYRAVLVDQPYNIIGFSGYGNQGETYFVYSYNPGTGFTRDMAEDVNGGSWMSPRGVRIGDVLYVVKGNAVESYSLKTFKKIDDLLI